MGMVGLLPFEQKEIPQPFPVVFSGYVAQNKNTFLGMKTLLLVNRNLKAHTLESITINVHSFMVT